MTRDHAEDVIRSSSLGASADELSELLLPSVRISAARVAAGDAGPSHFGGRPVLPPGVAWPARDSTPQLRSELEFYEKLMEANPGSELVNAKLERCRRQMAESRVPLHFLAQINLAHLAAGGGTAARALPAEGRLLFFYDAIGDSWGFDPRDTGSWRVIYSKVPGPGEVPAHPPDHEPPVQEFDPSTLRFSEEWTLPDDYRRDESDDKRWRDAYRQLRESLIGSEGGIHHRMFGHPQTIQGDMRLECQLVSSGLYCGDSSGYRDPRRKALEAGAADWRMLLQIDSDEDNPGWMWGDSGRLYFWIREQDLAARDFAHTWCILQCY